MPRQWDSVKEIPFGEKDAPKLFFVKYQGAPGGKGFFKFKTEDEFWKNVLLAEHKGDIKGEDKKNITIQEYIPGNRHYLHFFATPFFDKGLKVGDYNLELLSEDRRDEAADELHRIGFDHEELKELGINPDYEVIGNIPLVLREKLIGRGFELGKRVLESSFELVGGMIGPFCLETVVTKGQEFYCFEISTRIVAGTNLYTKDCPHAYTVKTWGYGMSHGDRIALEIEEGIKRKELHKIIY
jgi:5-formaminoimidazole-4-carboxamide-1-(beta)-D-ribofuranosyl 5'-monophosphate synthetase